MSSFIVVAGVWVAAGSTFCVTQTEAWSIALFGFLLFSSLALFDLYALSAAIRYLTRYATEPEGSNKKSAIITQAIIWSLLKIFCLIAIALVLIKFGKSFPGYSLILGLSTLVVVPIVGGFFWSRNELKE